jgi:hypothetical protein
MTLRTNRPNVAQPITATHADRHCGVDACGEVNFGRQLLAGLIPLLRDCGSPDVIGGLMLTVLPQARDADVLQIALGGATDSTIRADRFGGG